MTENAKDRPKRGPRGWFVLTAILAGVILGQTTLSPFLDGMSDALAGREPRTAAATE